MFSVTSPREPVKCRRLNWDLLMGKVNDNFQRNLKFLLKKERGRAASLADKLGVSRSTVTRWLKGEMSPNVDQIDEIASFCGETPERLLLTDLTGAQGAPPDSWSELGRVLERAGYRIVRDS